MKPIIAVISAMVLAAGVLTGSVRAQQADHSMDLSAVLATPSEQTLHVTDEPTAAVAVQKVVSTSRTSEREATVSNLSEVVAKLVAENANGSTELLRAGQTIHLMASINDDRGVIERHSVNVKISYDARPVGGILNIRVELVPIFGGIGAAVRPAASREFAEAVDSFDDDFIGTTITRLTSELAAEFAAK